MRREQAKSLLDQVVSAARGEEIEVILGGGTEALTRFANNEITQNVAERRYLLSVRVVQGKRTGRATGNDLSRAGIERLIERASDATRLQPEIADLLPLPGPQEYRAVDALDLETESLGAEVRAREVGRAVDRCRKAGLEGAGIYEVRAGTIGDYGEIGALAIANSRGLFAYHVGTSATFRVSALDGTASGWAGRESHRARDVSGDALSARAVEKALRSREPKFWEPGRYAVVLEPAAVADLIQDMSWISFGALLVQEEGASSPGRSVKKSWGRTSPCAMIPFIRSNAGAHSTPKVCRRVRRPSSSAGSRRARSTTGRPRPRKAERARVTASPCRTPTVPWPGTSCWREAGGPWTIWSERWTGVSWSRASGTRTWWIPRR